MIELDLNNFDYYLDKEKIAKFPLDNRSSSKLLIYKNNEIIHSNFYNLGDYLNSDFFLVRNSTKVIYARLIAKKITGGKAEILCVEPFSPSNDPQIALSTQGECIWKCIIGGSRINIGSKLLIENQDYLFAEVIKKEANIGLIKFNWDKDITFGEILNKIGEIPLPPYLERNSEIKDKETYQTIYANKEGSVAAPTAGLHFDAKIESELLDKNIDILDLTLHVGPGTFLPISDEIKNHKMHEEMIFISKETIRKIKANLDKGKNLVSVGTTTIRTLESLYWYGVKINENINTNFEIDQNYELQNDSQIAFSVALDLILSKHINDDFIYGKTSIFILPGYKIRTANALITNFHQPKSTLLLLISAFIGDENRKKIYKTALENDYRFLSYGDSSILFRSEI